MFDYHFYIFILLFLFAVLLVVFNTFIAHASYIDMLTWILMVVPAIGFAYLLKFKDANVIPFYILFSAVLVVYIVVFAGERIYTAFTR